MIKNNLIKLTCIINVKNGEKYIYKAINSVINQTIPVKIVVIDNHSTDNSSNIIKSFSNVQYFKTPYSCSLGEARNYSLTKVSSEYIAWLDCDDLWENNFAEKSVELLDKNPEIGFVSSECADIDENDNYLSIKKESNNSLHAAIIKKGRTLEQYFYNLDGPWSSYVFRSLYVKMTSGFALELTYAEDLDFILSVYKNCNYRSLHTTEALCKYRYHLEQQTNKIPLYRHYLEKINVLHKFKQEISYIKYINIIMYYKFFYYRNLLYFNKSFNIFLKCLFCAMYPVNTINILKNKLGAISRKLCQTKI